MDVSIQTSKPGDHRGAGLPLFWATLLLWIVAEGIFASGAHGFSLRNSGGAGSEIRLRPQDILNGGGSLGAAAEQNLDQGLYQATLSDFTQPLDLSIGGGSAVGSLTATASSDRGFEIRLTQQERDDCLSEADFDIQVNLNNLSSPSGGSLTVAGFQTTPRRRGGGRGRCTNRIRFGYAIDLILDAAVSGGAYSANAGITVTRRSTGVSQVLQMPVRVSMPGLLLLYHYSQIQIDLQASALAGAFGASSACAGDFCLGVGNRTVPVSNFGVPLNVDIGALVPAFVPVQTITLRDAVGVRAVGCTANQYDTATYQVLNPIGGILPASGVITDIQSQACSLNMRTGNLSFDLDLTQVNGANAQASATIEITVVGF